MGDKKDCPCDCDAMKQLTALVDSHDGRLDEHERRLDAHEERLSRGDTSFAVIKDKLNLIIGILGTIGAAVAAALMNQLL